MENYQTAKVFIISTANRFAQHWRFLLESNIAAIPTGLHRKKIFVKLYVLAIVTNFIRK